MGTAAIARRNRQGAWLLMGALQTILQLTDAAIFGGRIEKALRPRTPLHDVDDRRGWMRILEPYTGAWQRNVDLDLSAAGTFHADFACKTLIARDVAKLRLKLVTRDRDGIWTETTNPAFSPVLRKPNPHQTHNQFWENWILSKLSNGNTYVLKQYDNRNVVVAMFVLDPNRVWPMVAEDGSVFYRLHTDKLSGLPAEVIVPARAIIHDRMNCLFHSLVGIPPIYASALAAVQGLNIQNQSARLFQNNSTPGGTISAPFEMKQEQADQIKQIWETSFSGKNFGRVAILDSGMKYDQTAFINAVDGQLIEQLKWTAEVVCSTYHVPPYKVGVGPLPSYNNVQALNVEYFSQGLQSLIEEAEECLDEGLGIGWGVGLGTEFDVDNLLRMDSVTQMDVLEKAKNLLTLDERRNKLGFGHITGGNTVYMQLQDHSVEAIAARDAMLIANPAAFAGNAPSSPAPDAEEEAPDDEDEDAVAMAQLFAWEVKSQLALPDLRTA
jgi:HK97 family phage portal protein